MERWPCAGALSCLVLALLLAPRVDGSGNEYGLLSVPDGGEEEIRGFVRTHMEPRHAVAVLVASKSSKRRTLLEELAADTTVRHVLVFGVQHAKGKSSLSVHRHRYPTEVYVGKWTRSALRTWLLEVGYPLVNRMQYQFAPPKYLTETSFGTVLIVKPLGEQTDQLVHELEAFAEIHRSRLKFTFFTKAPTTQELCKSVGVWTNDELLLLEDPRQGGRRAHSHVPGAPKYRLEEVTPTRIREFFQAYAAHKWPRYLQSATPRAPPALRHSVRELTGWDFVETVHDPNYGVLVEFVSANCEACEEFAKAYQEVAQRLSDVVRREDSVLSRTLIARIDQSANEHTELIRGTPWMRYWPRGHRKRPVDVELRNVDRILAFLEEQAAAEAEEGEGVAGESSVALSSKAASGAGQAKDVGAAGVAQGPPAQPRPGVPRSDLDVEVPGRRPKHEL